MKYGYITMTHSLHGKVSIGKGKLNHKRKSSAAEVGGKIMLIVFFDYQSPLYQHFVLPNMTIDKEYYLEVLKILQWHVNQKCLELRNLWILHPEHVFTILHDWGKNTSKTPMLNCHLIRHIRQISHRAIFGCFQPSRSISVVFDSQ